MNRLQRVLSYPGSKWSMVDWILEHIPPHTMYLEPFFGSGAVLFNKNPSAIETINDLDGDVINLFSVIRDHAEELARIIDWTPWSRSEFYQSYEQTGDPIEDARRFLVRCHQAIGSRIGNRSGWKRTTKGDTGQNAGFLRLSEKILECTKRLKNVQIENKDAIQLIQEFNDQKVLIYADPPYVFETRTDKKAGRSMYKNEMSDAQHRSLINVLLQHQGPVLLSGYDNEIYAEALQDWTKETFIAMSDSGGERTECLWINKIAAKSSNQMTLF